MQCPVSFYAVAVVLASTLKLKGFSIRDMYGSSMRKQDVRNTGSE